MTKSLLAAIGGLFIRPALAAPAIIRPGEFRGRAKVADVAFGFRMGAGSVGTVNRTHPASIEPALLDATNPATFFGQGVLVNTSANSVRAVLTSDTTTPTSLWGVTVRPFPFQAATATNYGATPFAGEAPAPGAIDVLRSGYILVPLGNFAAANATKSGQAYIWFAASTGNHVQGTWEAAATGGSTALITGAFFNGPSDANGVVELAFNI